VQILSYNWPWRLRGGVEVKFSFFNIGARSGWLANTTLRRLYPQERDPIPIVKEAGWVQEPVWTGVENLALPGSDPRNVQSVASRYTDNVILAHYNLKFSDINKHQP
jgi:hypothetical protein